MRKSRWLPQLIAAIVAIEAVCSVAWAASPAARYDSEFFTPRTNTETTETFDYVAEPLFGSADGELSETAETLSETSPLPSPSLQTPEGFQLPRSRTWPPKSPGSAGGALTTAFGISMFIAASGDLATTEMALGRDGFYEANPLQRNRAVRIASHVAVPALIWWATDRVQKKGHGKLATVLRVVVTAVYGYATMHNANQMR